MGIDEISELRDGVERVAQMVVAALSEDATDAMDRELVRVAGDAVRVVGLSLVGCYEQLRALALLKAEELERAATRD